jgi:hypothetical protein
MVDFSLVFFFFFFFCLNLSCEGAVQPRRLGRFKQTFIMEFSRVQTSDGTTKFAVFKRTDTVPSDNELQTASSDDAIIPSQSRPDRGAFIKVKTCLHAVFCFDGKLQGAGKLPSHMYACLKTIVQTGFETTEFDPVKGENFGFLRQADCVPCGVFSPKKLTGPDAFAYAQGLKRGFVWLEYFDPGAQTKDALDELQLLDHVALQCDRHQENYFVQGSNVFGIDLGNFLPHSCVSLKITQICLGEIWGMPLIRIQKLQLAKFQMRFHPGSLRRLLHELRNWKTVFWVGSSMRLART